MAIPSLELSGLELDQLEALVDRYTLAVVINSLAMVCDAKEQHLRENWQDVESARDWSRIAGRLCTLARVTFDTFGR
jgi:hypothetical protein